MYKNEYDNSLIDIGDSVILINEITKEKIEYKIVQSYYDYKPADVSKDSYSFGSIIYNRITINNSNIDEGEILSDCLVAKILLGKKVGNIVKLPDGEFLINKIRKHKMYIN